MRTRESGRRLAVFCLLLLSVHPLDATVFWSGQGGDANWSTPGNWAGGSIPANPDSTTLSFTQPGAGATNVMDRNWSVRYLVCSNQEARHTFDLAGNKLVVWTHLMAGHDVTNSWATVRNGTLQLGTGIYSGSLYSGYKVTASRFVTNTELVVQGTLSVSNGNAFYVGFGSSVDGTAAGLLDLSGCTIETRGVTNLLSLANIWVSYRSVSPSILKLPASLGVLELTGTLTLGGYGIAPVPGWGILDFGEGSSLTNWRVRGDFLMGDNSASGLVTNMPSGVHLEVGLPNTPRKMRISDHIGRYANGSEARLRLVNGRLTAHLTDLWVGTGHTQGEGTSTGVLDLATSAVQIGPEPDRITSLTSFRVCSGKSAYGLLRLPPEVSAISAGEFTLGNGSYFGSAGKEAQGFLDIGSNSQLRAITATNGFYYATENGKAALGYTDGSGLFVEAFPTGLTLTVGSPEAAAPLHIAGGGAGIWYPYNTGSVVLAQGALNAWVSDLYVGFVSETSAGHPYYGFASGLLDLRDAAVAFNGITNSVAVNRLIVGGITKPGQSGPKGTLLLPSSITNLSANRLIIGCGGSYLAGGGQGLLDFGPGSLLRTLAISQDLWLGAQNGATGTIANLPTQNWTFSVGSPELRGSLILGSHDTANYAKKGEGVLAPTGALFSAWLTNLWVGASFAAGVQGGVSGRLDLTASTLAALDVDGQAIVGMGSNTYSASRNSGVLMLPPGEARMGSLLVGNLNITNTFGLVELAGTRVAVTNGCRVLPSGAITNRIGATSAGLDIRNPAADALTVTPPGRISLLFTADPPSPGHVLWGLRWNGDRRTELAALLASGGVRCQTNALSAAALERFGVHYDYRSGDAFIGVNRLLSPGVLLQIY